MRCELSPIAWVYIYRTTFLMLVAVQVVLAVVGLMQDDAGRMWWSLGLGLLAFFNLNLLRWVDERAR